MLSTSYAQDRVLKGQHTNGVNCLAFSPHANYLASGGNDCKLVVWNISNGTVACIINAQNPVLLLTWDPCCQSTIIFGCENGVAGVLSDFKVGGSDYPFCVRALISP